MSNPKGDGNNGQNWDQIDVERANVVLAGM